MGGLNSLYGIRKRDVRFRSFTERVFYAGLLYGGLNPPMEPENAMCASGVYAMRLQVWV